VGLGVVGLGVRFAILHLWMDRCRSYPSNKLAPHTLPPQLWEEGRMPQLPRVHVPGAMYHVTARGNHRQDIFFKDADRSMLDEIMTDALEHTGARFMRSTG
jgi:hypothetical protein